MLHGGGLSWWNYRELAGMLEGRYHVVIPVLDGHADSGESFVSIEENAARLLTYIDQALGGHVLALCGLSLGAQIAVEMLHRRPEVCRYAMIESASLIPSVLTNRMIEPAFASSYFLIRQDWFSRLQFWSLHMKEELYEDYYRDTCKITKADLIAFMKASTAYHLPKNMQNVCAKTCVIVGGKEQRSMKQSAKLLASALPDAQLFVMEGLYHGEFSLNYPEKYVQMLENLIGDTI